MSSVEGANSIRTSPIPDCYVCGLPGRPLYSGWQDNLFGVPGKWNLSQCPDPDCGLIWPDPMPIKEDIGKAYAQYYTKSSTARAFSKNISVLPGTIFHPI